MPTLYKPCASPGCGARVPLRQTRCEPCAAKNKRQRWQESDRRRPNSNARGYTYRWRKVRKNYLMRHPLCAECERQGRITAATVVDHIIPHKNDPVRMWSESNFQALCASCHDHKTGTEAHSPKPDSDDSGELCFYV